jgi:hypothetical protein
MTASQAEVPAGVHVISADRVVLGRPADEELAGSAANSKASPGVPGSARRITVAS